TTVQCVAGVVDFAVKRIKSELLPRYPNVDDVVALEHHYGCGVGIDAPDASIPIRTLRNISLNPNFGGEVMVVSLGCEKLQPERLVRAGAAVMFSEVTEVRDGIAQLTARAATPEVAQALVREMAWYDAYLARGRVDRSANTTPGNKKGGLANIVEKAMGSIVKSGSAPISGVLSPGEKVKQKGLIYAATPASDFICGTLQLAAGMNLHIFTTGRGTP